MRSARQLGHLGGMCRGLVAHMGVWYACPVCGSLMHAAPTPSRCGSGLQAQVHQMLQSS